MTDVVLRPFVEDDFKFIESILKSIGWAEQYVSGQLKSIERLIKEKEGEVFIAALSEESIGFIQTQHHAWNRLSYILGLVVSPEHRKKGVARKLVSHIETSARTRGNRGVYVDTPVDNLEARKFYTAIGFKEGYIMPEFYEPGLDGVAFQKFFK